jgi:ADP-ribose pyrophosphatase YjhB (NUDIX family)
MPAPVTPKVGTDTFVLNDRSEVCLIRRTDNQLWALPGGYQNLGETPAGCAAREFHEETGYHIRVTGLLGVYSSLCYQALTRINRGREVTHLLFLGELIGGDACPSDESSEIGWFSKDSLPPLSDGHQIRVLHGFDRIHPSSTGPYFE